MKKVFPILFFVSFFISAQNENESLNILAGKWKSETGNSFEEWVKINDSTFTGSGYFVEEGKQKIFEIFTIIELNDHIVYIAQPRNNLPTLFTLIYSEGNKFIFENQEHDFPQRVIYHFTTDTTLSASIEGEEKGKIKKEEFSFRRIK